LAFWWDSKIFAQRPPYIAGIGAGIYEFFGSSTQRDNHVRVNNPRPTRITKFVGYEFVKFR